MKNLKAIKTCLTIAYRFSLIIVCCLGFSFCTSPNKTDRYQAPLFDNLGTHQLAITTDSEMAQRFFNQGLNLTYGFNHGEAERSYREAVRLDSTCAMCYWGIANVLGTNYNAAMEDDLKQEARQMTQKALEWAEGASAWEQALIEASSARFNYDKTQDQSLLDIDYAEAMRAVYRQFPEHEEISVLFAESLMNTHPWDLYTKSGEPKPWTPEITRILEDILERNPKHPGANHFYIHAVESSSTPERGLPAAERLEDLVPGAGHLVHMPSHIYIRTGHYHKGSLVNEKATVADSLYIANCNAQGAYPLAYFPHNIHFLAATAALEGRGQASINAAFRVSGHTDTSVMREEGLETLQHYWVIPHYVLVKFRQWDEILKLDKPDDDLLYPLAVWHYAQGMAFTGHNRLDEAQESLAALKMLAANPALRDVTVWDINSTDQLTQIASLVLEAEILWKQGDRAATIPLLQEAVSIEDELNYNEPPDWFFSVRHTLGAVLLEDQQYQSAEIIYREDLSIYPENGWALNGLYQSLQAQNKEEALEVKERLDRAWQYADVELVDSRVKSIAYQDIQQHPLNGSIWAQFQSFASCALN